MKYTTKRKPKLTLEIHRKTEVNLKRAYEFEHRFAKSAESVNPSRSYPVLTKQA